MERKVNVVEDLDGNKIVVIHDIRFKGRQAIEWNDVQEYLKQYVGEAVDVYLELCKEENREPEKPYKGSFKL